MFMVIIQMDGKMFEYRTEIVGETPDRSPQTQNSGDTDQPAQPRLSSLNVKVTVPLKYFSNFWRSNELFLMNCKVELDLSWSQDCVLIAHHNNITGVNFMITVNDVLQLLMIIV